MPMVGLGKVSDIGLKPAPPGLSPKSARLNKSGGSSPSTGRSTYLEGLSLAAALDGDDFELSQLTGGNGIAVRFDRGVRDIGSQGKLVNHGRRGRWRERS